MQAFVVALWLVSFAPEAATPWEEAYQGTDATGPQVVGLWKFDDDRGLDATGRLPKGELKGARLAADGKFGGALESFGGHPEDDRAHGFVVPHSPRLNFTGAFTLELWIKPKAEFERRGWSVLIDKKYASHDDYQLAFTAADGKRQRRLTLSLGFGGDSQNFLSDAAAFDVDAWTHVAAIYDGRGKVRFFRDGQAFGSSVVPGRGAVSAGNLPLSIGDRLGSNYPGFPGYLDEVRLSQGLREFARLRVRATWSRRTFVRFEPRPVWQVEVENADRVPLRQVRVAIDFGTGAAREVVVPELAPGGTERISGEFDTSLRPDAYEMNVVAAVDGERPQRVRESTTVTLVGRPVPHRMPVVMWGIGGVKEVVTELPRLKRLGFTHCFGCDVDYQRIAKAEGPTEAARPDQTAAAREMLDAALAADLRILATTWPGYLEPYFEAYRQVGRDGKPPKRHSLTPNAPPVLAAFERLGASIGRTYADHPAFAGICVNSEIRDESEVSFTEWDLAAYRRRFGAEAKIPDWVTSKYPPNHATLRDFPADRVVPDDHPQLEFCRWWWGGGDGWNAAHSAVHKGLRGATARPDVWTFHDPAVRCPPIGGSGGDVDVLSQWTYTDPDPLRIALPADELVAMARLRDPAARIMKMTQLFWYRSTAAPADSSPRDGDAPAKWADQDPSTSFISIHPAHLREAFWTKISRPVEGIMYHGWSSLVPTDGSHAYKYTHPELQHELSRLVRDVVEPLGPMLRQVPGSRGDVAFLESFTSFAFALRSSWGYAGGTQADLYFALLHARLQPEIVYEEHVLRDGLDGYKLLVLADCDVLPRRVVDKILAYQRAGGLVAGDSRLCPAIKPDVLLPSFARKKDAATDAAALRQLAGEIRARLDGKYRRAVDTDSPDVVPHVRRAGSASYVFLVNDAREAGDYVGQYGRVLEQGRPTTTSVRIAGPVRAVYDLTRRNATPVQRDGDAAVVTVTLGPCDGTLLLAVPRPIGGLRVEGPAETTVGAAWEGIVQVDDDTGKPIDAVVPVRIDVVDPDGRLAEPSGWYGAAQGRLTVRFDVAPNDRPGVWTIRAAESATGRVESRYFRVAKRPDEKK